MATLGTNGLAAQVVPDVPYTLEHNTAHESEAKGLLIQQYKRKPRIEAVLGAVAKQVQKVEDAFWDLYFKRRLENAEGKQVDGIGSIVGEERNDRNDVDYKVAIRVRALINRSNGRVNEIIKLVRTALGDGGEAVVVQVIEEGTHIEVHIHIGLSTSQVKAIRGWLNEVRGATYRLDTVSYIGGAADQFILGSVYGTPPIQGKGLGSVYTALVGGLIGTVWKP